MTALVFYLLVFLAVGTFFLFIHLMMGKVVRPARPGAEKLTIYECGEPTVGSAWIQFDLRYYVVALLFVVFDVEVAFFFPWAVVFGNATELSRTDVTNTKKIKELSAALVPAGIPGLNGGLPTEAPTIHPDTARSWAWLGFIDILVFFGVLMVGFAYLWRRGDIDWVRSTAAERTTGGAEPIPVRLENEALVSAK